jgi:hypothetical protein
MKHNDGCLHTDTAHADALLMVCALSFTLYCALLLL